MTKPKSLEEWGRGKARERYASGGDVPPIPIQSDGLPQSGNDMIPRLIKRGWQAGFGKSKDKSE